jgi:hypothetical protein
MIHPGVWVAGSLLAVGVGIAVAFGRQSGGVTGTHKVGASGWVEVDPEVLAGAAGVSANVYALASMMQSEGGGNQLLRYAVGWAARNSATNAGVSVFKKLTRAGKYDKTAKAFQHHPSSGFYGPQNVGPRYASTRVGPSAQALLDAADVLSGAVDDPTDGATQWDAPGAQDSLLAAGLAGYNQSAEDIARSRTKSSDLVMVPGITSTRFWRPRA